MDPVISVQNKNFTGNTKELEKSSWSGKGILKSFTLAIPWNLAKPVKIFPRIIARLQIARVVIVRVIVVGVLGVMIVVLIGHDKVLVIYVAIFVVIFCNWRCTLYMESFAMKTDIPTNGSTVKNHISLETRFGYSATRRTSFRSWFLACQRVLPPVLPLQHQ